MLKDSICTTWPMKDVMARTPRVKWVSTYLTTSMPPHPPPPFEKSVLQRRTRKPTRRGPPKHQPQNYQRDGAII